MDIETWNASRLILNKTKEEDFNELGPLLLNYETSKFIPKYPIQIRTVDSAKIFLMKIYLINRFHAIILQFESKIPIRQ